MSPRQSSKPLRKAKASSLLYADDLPLFEKIRPSPEIYRADDATADKSVKDQLKTWEEWALQLPVCIAKTQYCSRLIQIPGRADGVLIPVREVRLSAGAEFVVAICGEIMTMPDCQRCRLPTQSTSMLRVRSSACSRPLAIAGIRPAKSGLLLSNGLPSAEGFRHSRKFPKIFRIFA